MAFDFLVAFDVPNALKSILPKIELRGPSLPEPIESENVEFKGVKAGASGRKDGPEAEKLNSL